MKEHFFSSDRVAWLLPAMGTGGISFQHLLSEFTKIFPNTIVFTGQWPGYAVGFENEFTVQEVGATRHVELAKAANGYSIGFSYASPQIVNQLLKFRPAVVFANAFSIWTVVALALKAIGGWKVIIVYEGGSPAYESRSQSIRLLSRQAMVRLADAFVINSQLGRDYFTQVLGVSTTRLFVRPFLVPSVKALLQCPEGSVLPRSETSEPIFLFVGQLIARKGPKLLLEACLRLKQQGYEHYRVWVVGDGEQRSEIQQFAEQHGLSEQIEWLGKVEYRCMGAYFQAADVFVFPTYDDIWGMVLVEAMAFGKPVICSTGAAATELMVDGQNGFTCSPGSVEHIAQSMRRFLDDSTLIQTMGDSSLQIMAEHTAQTATHSFVKALQSVLSPPTATKT